MALAERIGQFLSTPVDILTRPPESPPVLNPPKELTRISLETQEVALLVHESVVERQILRLAREIQPAEYDIIFLNREGGTFLARKLECAWKKMRRKHNSIVPIQYQSIAGPNQRNEVNAIIPVSTWKDINWRDIEKKRALVIEASDDSGKTLGIINKDARNLGIDIDIAILMNKQAKKEVINPNIKFIGMHIPDLWMAGGGEDSSRPEIDAEFNRLSSRIIMPMDIALQYYSRFAYSS
jgi:hypoxanthine-guanine phosphoribosyltransferase